MNRCIDQSRIRLASGWFNAIERIGEQQLDMLRLVQRLLVGCRPTSVPDVLLSDLGLRKVIRHSGRRTPQISL
jgi:hypothetical protein